MHRVADVQQRALAATDEITRVARRVALDLHRLHDARHDLGAGRERRDLWSECGDQRGVIGDAEVLRGVGRELREERPLRRGKMNRRVGERELAFRIDEPADVIAVSVGDEDVRDAARLDSRGSERGAEAAGAGAEVRTGAGVEQQHTIIRLHQQRLDAEAQFVGRQSVGRQNRGDVFRLVTDGERLAVVGNSMPPSRSAKAW